MASNSVYTAPSAVQLLDPKAFKNKMANGVHDKQPSEIADQGLSSHIERLHGVQERTERPAKRQKVNDDTESNKSKGTFGTISKGGELGQYVKDKQQEGAKEDPSTIVDLTGGMPISELSKPSSIIAQRHCMFNFLTAI